MKSTRGTRSKNVSSFQVFMSFVEHSKDGEVSVDKLFSKDCFKKWLETRGGKITYPQQSFQRVLHAHIRGTDKRKPFSKEVEKEILKTLRKQPSTLVWRRIFGNKSFRLGKRGFKKPGYHEKLMQKKIEDQKLPKTSSSLSLSLDLDVMDFATPSTPTVPSFLDYFLHTLYTVCGPHQSKSVLDAARDRGCLIDAPVLRYILSFSMEETNPQFNLNFLLPSTRESFFRKGRLIGQACFSDNFVCVKSSAEVDDIFGASLLDKHLFEIESSMVSVALSYTKLLGPVQSGSVVWRRCVSRNALGEHMTLLFNMFKEGDNYIVQFQDVSQEHTHLEYQPSFV